MKRDAEPSKCINRPIDRHKRLDIASPDLCDADGDVNTLGLLNVRKEKREKERVAFNRRNGAQTMGHRVRHDSSTYTHTHRHTWQRVRPRRRRLALLSQQQWQWQSGR